MFVSRPWWESGALPCLKPNAAQNIVGDGNLFYLFFM